MTKIDSFRPKVTFDPKTVRITFFDPKMTSNERFYQKIRNFKKTTLYSPTKKSRRTLISRKLSGTKSFPRAPLRVRSISRSGGLKRGFGRPGRKVASLIRKLWYWVGRKSLWSWMSRGWRPSSGMSSRTVKMWVNGWICNKFQKKPLFLLKFLLSEQKLYLFSFLVRKANPIEQGNPSTRYRGAKRKNSWTRGNQENACHRTRTIIARFEAVPKRPRCRT